MIKQIHIRGISRTPSDHASEDGGCSESLNVQIDVNETGPAPQPRDATSRVTTGDYIDGDVVYVHKSSLYENYIVLRGSALYAYINRVQHTIIPSGGITGFRSITSIGNTLVISTDEGPVYARYKDGEYGLLVGNVPVPHIEFRVDLDDSHAYTYSRTVTAWQKTVSGSASLNIVEQFGSSVWNTVTNLYPGSMTDQQKEYKAEIDGIISECWGKVEEAADNHLGSKLFTYPRLARYAVRLYDGSYVNVSAPVYLGAGFREAVTMKGGHTTQSSWVNATLQTVYSAVAQLKGWNPGEWRDLIESIDLFLSPAIPFPAINTRAVGIGQDGTIIFDGEQADRTGKAWEENLLSATTFYKIASFGMDDLSDIQAAAGYNLLEDPTLGRDENLVAQERLDVDSTREYNPGKVITYNQRIVSYGGSEVLSSGYGYAFAPSAGDYTGFLKTAQRSGCSFRVRYFCRDSVTGETKTVMGRTHDGSLDIPCYEIDWSDQGGVATKVALPYGVLFFPDPTCFKAEFKIDGDGYFVCAMKPHPLLNCSYGILGADTPLEPLGPWPEEIVQTEDRTIAVSGIMVSEFKNPFIYPVKGRVEFKDDIVGIGYVTKPLSEGQAAGFDLYVFTDGGIYYAGLYRDGVPASCHLLSNDVALPGSVSIIDQAVVFITASGVKLLTATDIADLSPYMNGAPFFPPSDLRYILNESEWVDLVATVENDSTFMDFMAGAQCAYDYKGKRLIFFKDGYEFQWVYRFESKSWHKLLSGDASAYYILLAARPDCLVSYAQRHDLTRLTISVVHDAIERQMVSEILVRYNIDTGLPADLPAIYELDMDGETLEDLESDLNYSGCEYSDVSFSDWRTVMYNYETLLGHEALVDTVANSVRGIIITRALSFDADDVRKTIAQLRIRGRFNRGDVQYLLLVSLDGISWQVLRTLRGGSYKFFRIVVLTNLSPTERISWIEADVEGRFANKLR